MDADKWTQMKRQSEIKRHRKRENQRLIHTDKETQMNRQSAIQIKSEIKRQTDISRNI